MRKLLAILMVLFATGCPQAVPGNIGTPGPAQWSTSPVIVYVDDSMPSYNTVAVRGAAEEWNAQVGQEVFRVYDLSEANVAFMIAPQNTITVSQAELGTRLLDIGDEPLTDFRTVTILGIAEINYRTTGSLRSCMILLDYELDVSTALPVMTHELGHCLLLGHSYDRNSIMYIDATLSPEQHITQSDLTRAMITIPYP